MTFDELKQAVKSHHNLVNPESDTRIGQSLNRHYRRVTSLIGMDATRYVTRSATMTVGVATVTFTSIEKIDRVIDTTDSDAIRLLTEVPIHQIRSNQPSDGQPDAWALQNTDATSVTIRTDTVPQTAYSLQADGWTSLADLTGTDSPAFPESFHDILTNEVISEEYLRKGKIDLASAYKEAATTLIDQLNFHLADSPTRETRQGESTITTAVMGSGGGGGSVGGTSYTQSGLITFDRGAATAPFAVAQSTAAVVTNLDADELDGQHGSYYLTSTNQNAGTLPDARLSSNVPLKTDKLSVFAATTSAELAGVLSDETGSGGGFVRATSPTIATPSINTIDLTGGQIAFPATQAASSGANTLDDYEEGTWTPADGSGAALSFTTVEAVYVKVGQLVFCAGRLTYPATADGSAAIISGFPFTIANTSNNQFVGGIVTDLAANAALRGIKNTTTAAVVTPSTNAAIVNSTLSGKFIIFNFTYRATA